MGTKIEWASETWNPVTGCSPISEGCQNCYAERMSKRLAGRFGYPAVEPFQPTFHADKLNDPSRWQKPRPIFVCSMGDLFHEGVPFAWVDKVFDIIVENPRHTFMILTKRPKRMALYFPWGTAPPNVWLGVTAENQERADERIPILLSLCSKVLFVSIEPILGPVDISAYLVPDFERCRLFTLDWVICGGETGQRNRPMDIGWAKDLRDQCANIDLPFFFKKVGDGRETPPDLIVQERPE